MSRIGIILVGFLFFLPGGCARGTDRAPEDSKAPPAMLIVIDGLRVDYVTPEWMPNLTERGAEGIVFQHHHAVFPTLTQVNAASLVTGAHPSTHGILGDTLFDPRYSDKPLRTSWAGVLENLDRASGGRALNALTVGELLEGKERDLLVVTSGSSGLAWLLGYGAQPRPGRSRVLSPELFLPAELEGEIAEARGPVPDLDAPAQERDAWATEVFLDAATAGDRPDLAILWLSGPDVVQSASGVGSPQAHEAVRAVDRELGEIVTTLREKGLLDETNLFITADHGYIRHTGGATLPELLIGMGLEEALASKEIRVVEHEIHLENRKDGRLDKVVRALGRQASVGGLFTSGVRSGRPDGRVEGTLSYQTINCDHERAGDVRVVPNWSDEVSDEGYPGLAAGSGPAGHGGASPYELRVPLVASGPAFRKTLSRALPSAHVDLAPTLLHILDIDVPASMEGRVLFEALKEGADPADEAPMIRTYRGRMLFDGGGERLTALRQQAVGGVTYLDWIRALYRPASGAATPQRGTAPAASSSGE